MIHLQAVYYNEKIKMVNYTQTENKRKISGYIGKYPYFLKNKWSFSGYMIQIVGF
jgi:hypothetical protein